MNTNGENVAQAKKSFNHILDNKKYAGIIKDDNHLSLLLDLVDGGKYNKIIDIGTGTGYLAFPLAEKFRTSSICGIDIADAIIEKNNAVVKERGISNLSFQVFDGLKYPFSDENADLIVTRYAFHHFPDAADAVQQMNKILVEGGKVLISDPVRNEKDDKEIIDNFMRIKKDGHIRFYSLSELEKLFTASGFVKNNQVITDMKFPFAKQIEYIELFDRITEKEKALYNITNDNGIIWVNHINVGNTIFIKQ